MWLLWNFLYRPPTRAVSILPLLGHGVPRLPPGRKPPGPPPGPPPPQVLQMYGRKVGFALDLPPRRRDEDMLYSPELGKEWLFLSSCNLSAVLFFLLALFNIWFTILRTWEINEDYMYILTRWVNHRIYPSKSSIRKEVQKCLLCFKLGFFRKDFKTVSKWKYCQTVWRTRIIYRIILRNEVILS